MDDLRGGEPDIGSIHRPAPRTPPGRGRQVHGGEGDERSRWRGLRPRERRLHDRRVFLLDLDRQVSASGYTPGQPDDTGQRGPPEVTAFAVGHPDLRQSGGRPLDWSCLRTNPLRPTLAHETQSAASRSRSAVNRASRIDSCAFFSPAS